MENYLIVAISGIDKAEGAAKEILAHVAAIRAIFREADCTRAGNIEFRLEPDGDQSK